MNDLQSIQDYFNEFDDIHFSTVLSKQEKDRKKNILKDHFLKNVSTVNSDHYYFLGYMGYMSKDFSIETELSFKNALKLEPTSGFCQYYYGYYLFDNKRYKEAIQIFTSINLNFFRELGQIWRYFKIKEARLCCMLFLLDCPKETKVKETEEFLDEYENYIEADENNTNNPINYPIDLIKSISEIDNSLRLGFKTSLIKIISLMEKQGLDTTYNLEYAKLKLYIPYS